MAFGTGISRRQTEIAQQRSEHETEKNTNKKIKQTAA